MNWSAWNISLYNNKPVTYRGDDSQRHTGLLCLSGEWTVCEQDYPWRAVIRCPSSVEMAGWLNARSAEPVRE